MPNFFKNVRSACRRLYKNSGFSASAALTLALGIGVNTAIFSVVHAVLLRELPYRDSEQIISIENPQSLGLMGTREQFLDSTNAIASLQTVAAYHTAGANFVSTGEARRLVVAEVSSRFFDVMGIAPVQGRAFFPDEDAPEKDRIALISERLWRTEFASDPKALGAQISLNGQPFSILGVLPNAMDFPEHADIWTPTAFDSHSPARSGAFYLQFVGRLKNGTSVSQTQAEFVARAKQFSNLRAGRQSRAVLLSSRLTTTIRPALLMLLGTAGFVLAIACANIAGLMIVRFMNRRREIAIRVALGASRFELLREQAMETLVLAAVGAILGIVFGYAILSVFYRYFGPSLLGQFAKPTINLAVLGFTAGIALAAGLCSGLAPAWAISRQAPSLNINTTTYGDSKHARLLRKTLVAIEIALAIVLLSGAGLLIRTMQNLNKVPLGFDTRNLLTLSIALRGEGYASSQDPLHSEPIRRFYADALRHLQALPDVVSASLISNIPLGQDSTMALPLVPDNDASRMVLAELRIAGAGYFRTLSIPVVQGRAFSENEISATGKTIVLSRELAEKLWPGQDPVGRQISCPAFGKDSYLVLGVVASNRQHELREVDALPVFYLSADQMTWPSMTVVVRTQHDPKFIIEIVRKSIQSVDKSQPLFDVRTMEQRVSDQESLERFERMGLIVFASVAVILAAVGIYGTISYSVVQRTGEIGIRMALGASRQRTIATILREAVWPALAGSLSGVAVSFYLARSMSSIVFGISPHDPLTIVCVTAALLAVAFLAAYLPAQRAAFIDPIRALRAEG
jgi:putative ABC transport system permease protein